MFVVGTETDHVAPWKSVYKVSGLTSSPEFTFLLTSGGHNAGIVSGPVHPKRRHRVRTQQAGEAPLAADEWFATTEVAAGFLVADLGGVAEGAFLAGARSAAGNGRAGRGLRAARRRAGRVRPAALGSVVVAQRDRHGSDRSDDGSARRVRKLKREGLEAFLQVVVEDWDVGQLASPLPDRPSTR